MHGGKDMWWKIYITSTVRLFMMTYGGGGGGGFCPPGVGYGTPGTVPLTAMALGRSMSEVA